MGKTYNFAAFVLVTALLAAVILIIGCAQQPQKEQKDERYCDTDKDCACGVYVTTGECFYGNVKYVNTQPQCPDFCTGFAGDLTIKCVKNECRQVSKQ